MKNFREKVDIGLSFFFPAVGNLLHRIGLRPGGDVDVRFHRLVVAVAGPLISIYFLCLSQCSLSHSRTGSS